MDWAKEPLVGVLDYLCEQRTEDALSADCPRLQPGKDFFNGGLNGEVQHLFLFAATHGEHPVGRNLPERFLVVVVHFELGDRIFLVGRHPGGNKPLLPVRRRTKARRSASSANLSARM